MSRTVFYWHDDSSSGHGYTKYALDLFGSLYMHGIFSYWSNVHDAIVSMLNAFDGQFPCLYSTSGTSSFQAYIHHVHHVHACFIYLYYCMFTATGVPEFFRLSPSSVLHLQLPTCPLEHQPCYSVTYCHDELIAKGRVCLSIDFYFPVHNHTQLALQPRKLVSICPPPPSPPPLSLCLNRSL